MSKVKFCVSMSTIPSRIKNISRTLDEIENQTLQPDKIFLNIPYKDTQCGAKGFRASAWAKISPHIKERQWAFDLDVIAQARALNLSIHEVPVRWNHAKEGSKVRPFVDVPKTFISTFGIRKRASKTRSSNTSN